MNLELWEHLEEIKYSKLPYYNKNVSKINQLSISEVIETHKENIKFSSNSLEEMSVNDLTNTILGNLNNIDLHSLENNQDDTEIMGIQRNINNKLVVMDKTLEYLKDTNIDDYNIKLNELFNYVDYDINKLYEDSKDSVIEMTNNKDYMTGIVGMKRTDGLLHKVFANANKINQAYSIQQDLILKRDNIDGIDFISKNIEEIKSGLNSDIFNKYENIYDSLNVKNSENELKYEVNASLFKEYITNNDFDKLRSNVCLDCNNDLLVDKLNLDELKPELKEFFINNKDSDIDIKYYNFISNAKGDDFFFEISNYTEDEFDTILTKMEDKYSLSNTSIKMEVEDVDNDKFTMNKTEKATYSNLHEVKQNMDDDSFEDYVENFEVEEFAPETKEEDLIEKDFLDDVDMVDSEEDLEDYLNNIDSDAEFAEEGDNLDNLDLIMLELESANYESGVSNSDCAANLLSEIDKIEFGKDITTKRNKQRR